jgi:hypothetical protein
MWEPTEEWCSPGNPVSVCLDDQIPTLYNNLTDTSVPQEKHCF